MSNTTDNITLAYTQTTSRIDLIAAPNTSYIITLVFIGIIVLILIYFGISENSRNIIIALFYWFCLLIVKIIMLVPSLLALLYCYTYKSLEFIAHKIKKKPKINIVLQNIVVIDISTDATTDVSTYTPIDNITDTINFILQSYSCF